MFVDKTGAYPKVKPTSGDSNLIKLFTNVRNKLNCLTLASLPAYSNVRA